MAENYIKIGDTRIKIENIKTFGTSIDKTKGSPVPPYLIYMGIKEVLNSGKFFEGVKKGYNPPDREYLFVTTYQNDNYKFYSDEINIKETLEELESV
jgi:hypothetical protein